MDDRACISTMLPMGTVRGMVEVRSSAGYAAVSSLVQASSVTRRGCEGSASASSSDRRVLTLPCQSCCMQTLPKFRLRRYLTFPSCSLRQHVREACCFEHRISNGQDQNQQFRRISVNVKGVEISVTYLPFISQAQCYHGMCRFLANYALPSGLTIARSHESRGSKRNIMLPRLRCLQNAALSPTAKSSTSCLVRTSMRL